MFDISFLWYCHVVDVVIWWHMVTYGDMVTPPEFMELQQPLGGKIGKNEVNELKHILD